MLFPICGIFAILGAWIGRVLSRKGLNASFRIENKPGPFLWGIILLGMALCVLVVSDSINYLSWLPHIFPSWILLYLAAHFTDLLFVGSCFVLGLLIALEFRGLRSPQRLRQLVTALSILGCGLGILLHFAWPVAALVQDPEFSQEGVVLQTTPYTCAPASIANLTRVLGTHPNLSERDAANLSHTNRFGTSTLNQLRALKKLGIDASYRFGLTLQDLARQGQPAILNVRELYEGNRINHAVTLLRIDPQGRQLLIANPLEGLQLKSAQEMDEYWFGEAILVGNRR